MSDFRRCCRRSLRHQWRPLGDDEVPEQRAERLGLDRVRADCHQVIAEDAFLVVPDLVGLQHLAAHCAQVTTKDTGAA